MSGKCSRVPVSIKKLMAGCGSREEESHKNGVHDGSWCSFINGAIHGVFFSHELKTLGARTQLYCQQLQMIPKLSYLNVVSTFGSCLVLFRVGV